MHNERRAAVSIHVRRTVGGCPRMPFSPYQRYCIKIILAGKRRLRYQLYGCACFSKMPRSEKKILFSDNLLIWLFLSRRKNSPYHFLWFIFGIVSQVRNRDGILRRRLITLIYAGWLPHDLPASRSFLSLVPEVRQKPYSNRSLEGSLLNVIAPLAPTREFLFFSF